MSNDLDNAPASAPEEGSVEAPETPAEEAPEATELPTNESVEASESEVPADDAPTTAESDVGDVPTAEAAGTPEPAEETSTPKAPDKPAFPEIVIREALVAPDLSDLPDDIGDDFESAIAATVLEFKEGDMVRVDAANGALTFEQAKATAAAV